MPYHIAKSVQCPTSKPYAVIKDSDGSVSGCHPTQAAAQKQLAALNMNVNETNKEQAPVMSTNGATENPPRDGLVRALPGLVLREAADGEDSTPTLAGHFARFNEWTEINSMFEGHFMERIAPGAFNKTFSEQRDSMRVLFQHGHDPVVGDKPLGPIQTLEEDDEGARYEVPLLDTSYNRDLVEGLKAGLYGASFRFRAVREEFDRKPEESEWNPDGIPERTIREAQVYEFGPVTFPAYKGATAGVRSLTDEYIAERFAANPEQLARLLDFVTGRGHFEVTDSTVPTIDPTDDDNALSESAEPTAHPQTERRKPIFNKRRRVEEPSIWRR